MNENLTVTSESVLNTELFVAGSGLPVVTDSGTIASGANLTRGTVLGKATKAVGVPTYTDNTGNGTVGTIVLGLFALIGNYILTCLSKATAAAAAAVGAAVAGNTGAGTITAAPVTGAGVKIGIYSLVCSAVAVGGGKFRVEDPDGVVVGTAAVGVEFTKQLTFTIAAAGADFIIGDAFTITVSPAANGGVFSVKTPEGVLLANAIVGSAYVSPHINFTIADGNQDFIVGDVITIPVVAGSGSYKAVNSASVDGSQSACAILAGDAAAALADAVAPLYLTGEFNAAALTVGGADTVDTHKDALRKLGIFIKTVA